MFSTDKQMGYQCFLNFFDLRDPQQISKRLFLVSDMMGKISAGHVHLISVDNLSNVGLHGIPVLEKYRAILPLKTVLYHIHLVSVL